MTWTQTTLNLLDAAGTSHPVIAYTDGTNFAFAHPLLDSTGAIISPASSALQTAGNNLLSAIEASLAGTLAVEVASSALPSGAATAANQSTTNTSLATIATNTTAVPGVIALTVGTAATPGRSFAVHCTVAGNVNVTFTDGSSNTYPVSVGLNVFPFAVTTVNSSGTTATATYENWK